MSEQVSFPVAVAALRFLLDQPYAIEEVTHGLGLHVHGFGGREVYIDTDNDVYSVAFFRRFECSHYERKGAAMSDDVADDLLNELLKVLADRM